MKMPALLLAACSAVTFLVLPACGVTTQTEPRPLTTPAETPAPTPTVTQRPDSTTSTTPTTGDTAEPTPLSTQDGPPPG
ncbi:hypothetical protein A6A25_39420 [Saccharothrix sp. CB00851]|nr:hypothetical protein A6A25_39420 [Saccharothrix sp. CB00851]